MKEIGMSKDCPAIYERLKLAFPVTWDSGVIIADAPNIHCKFDIPPQKFIHELVHIRRQEAITKEIWWDLYLTKTQFRLEEEVLAYKAEYKFICENILDRNMRFECLYDLAQQLSSAQYGKLCTGDEAVKLIQG